MKEGEKPARREEVNKWEVYSCRDKKKEGGGGGENGTLSNSQVLPLIIVLLPPHPTSHVFIPPHSI